MSVEPSNNFPSEPESFDLQRKIQQVARFIVSRPDPDVAENEMLGRKSGAHYFHFMQPDDRYYAYYKHQKFASRVAAGLLSDETHRGVSPQDGLITIPELPSEQKFTSDRIRRSSIGQVSFHGTLRNQSINQECIELHAMPLIDSPGSALVSQYCEVAPKETSTSPPILDFEQAKHSFDPKVNACESAESPSGILNSLVMSHKAPVVALDSRIGEATSKRTSILTSLGSRTTEDSSHGYASGSILTSLGSRTTEDSSHVYANVLESCGSPSIGMDCIESHAKSPIVSSIPVATLQSQLEQISSALRLRRLRFDQHKFVYYEVNNDSKEDGFLYDIAGNEKVISFRTTTPEEKAMYDSLVEEHLVRDHEKRAQVKKRLISHQGNCLGRLERLPAMVVGGMHGLACCTTACAPNAIIIDEAANCDIGNMATPEVFAYRRDQFRM